MPLLLTISCVLGAAVSFAAGFAIASRLERKRMPSHAPEENEIAAIRNELRELHSAMRKGMQTSRQERMRESERELLGKIRSPAVHHDSGNL